MFAPLVVAAVVATDFHAADWLRCLRQTFADVRSLSVDFTLTYTRPGQPPEKRAGKLLLARDRRGRRVGDLTFWQDGAEVESYTLWAGKVYHRQPKAKLVTVYEPADGDPLRFAADHLLPALHLLTDRRPACRANGGDQFYFLIRMAVPAAPSSDVLTIGEAFQELVDVDLAIPSGPWPHIPADVPSYARVVDRLGQSRVFEVTLMRLNAANGPTAADIPDPTTLPAGWREWSPARDFKAAEERARRYAEEDRKQQRK